MKNSSPTLIPSCSSVPDRTATIEATATASTAELPEPLTPAECDLRDIPCMPLDVARLRDSDRAADESPAARWAGILLWCAAWHQVPATSLPDDNEWLAKRANYWHRGKIDKDWSAIRAGALRGWIKCSDGRLYHPVIAEKARAAWSSKLKQRFKTLRARIKRRGQRQYIEYDEPDFDERLSSGCPQGHPLAPPETGPRRQCSPDEKNGPPRQAGDVPRETPTKGANEVTLRTMATDGGIEVHVRASAVPRVKTPR